MDIIFELKKKIIKFKTCLIKDKKLRQQTRAQIVDELIDKKVQKTKWGVSYSVYDGEELLKGSIKSIRESVDYVQVVYQTKSWYGEEADKNLVPLLLNLKEKGLIDELIKFKPNLKINAGKNERTKRTLGIKCAKKAKVDYLMCMDTDEFFLKAELEQAKKTIINEHITHSYCPIVCYTNNPKERYADISGFAIPFFSKINHFSKAGKNYSQSIVLTDPNRTISANLFSKHYFLCGIRMHHFTAIRKDFEKKLRSSSCAQAKEFYELNKGKRNPNIYIYISDDIFEIQQCLENYNKEYSCHSNL